MFFLLSRISTWLFVEIIATFILTILNLLIPILMIFTSYRNLANFYFSSIALSSSLINCLYLFYLIQTIHAKTLSEMNCRAFYYFQTSCIVVLAYTIVAMHASLVLYLFPSPSPADEGQSSRRCCRSFTVYLRRFCFCFVILIWSISFTTTIPLLYTIDSNEKSPKSVYCLGATEISYLEEWSDRGRFLQTVVFNLIPLVISSLLSIIALAKLFYDCLVYIYFCLKTSSCFSSALEVPIQSFQQWFRTSFLRFIFVLSCCLLACIYPIVMRFYLIYFSVLVPLIFAVFNYSLVSAQSSTVVENQNAIPGISPTNTSPREQSELHLPLIVNLLDRENDRSTPFATPRQNHRLAKRNKRNYFANHLYENTLNMCVEMT